MARREAPLPAEGSAPAENAFDLPTELPAAFQDDAAVRARIAWVLCENSSLFGSAPIVGVHCEGRSPDFVVIGGRRPVAVEVGAHGFVDHGQERRHMLGVAAALGGRCGFIWFGTAAYRGARSIARSRTCEGLLCEALQILANRPPDSAAVEVAYVRCAGRPGGVLAVLPDDAPSSW